MLDVVKVRRDSLDFEEHTICSTIKRPKAFSWYNKMKKELPSDESIWIDYLMNKYKDKPDFIRDLWECVYEAQIHYMYITPVIKATHYLTREAYNSGKVDWALEGKVLSIIDNHVFLNQVP